MSSTPGSSSRLIALERQRAALDLRKAGMDYVSIGKRLGIATSTAHRLVMRALKRQIELRDGEAEELRELIMSQSREVFGAMYAKALGGDDKAANVCCRILEFWGRLYGMEAPVRVTGQDGGPIDIRIEDLRATLESKLDRLARSGEPA